MIRKFGSLIAIFLLTAVLLPNAARAYHTSTAVIDDVRYVDDNSGVMFFIDFRIWDHVGYKGTVRITITDGVDTVVALGHFQPAYNAARYRDFSIAVSNARLRGEGGFFTRSLLVTVEILDADGNVLTRDGGVMAWAGGSL